jgi:aconitate hydratase
MLLPKVVGYKLTGELSAHATATDLVLAITKNLRAHGVVDKFVEFYGPGVAKLSIADRATISNMAPEYGATVGFFAADNTALEYLRTTGRDEHKVALIAAYLKAQGTFRDYNDQSQDPEFSETLELDLGSIVPAIAGPKRPHDHVALSQVKTDFTDGLTHAVNFKSYGIKPEQADKEVTINFDGHECKLRHGSVLIAAITSCTNTSNPNVMVAAGLLAKKAVERGLRVAKVVKTSLAPGYGCRSRSLFSVLGWFG